MADQRKPDTAETKGAESRNAWNKGGEDDADILEKKRREKTPFFYCRIITNHPVRSFAVALSCHIGILVVSGILMASGFNLFPTYFESLPMELYTIPYRLRDYAWRDRDNYANKFTRTLPDMGYATYERGLFDGRSSIDLYYDTEGDNVFSKSYLQAIQVLENDLASSSSYNTSFCMTFNTSLSCKPFQSILRYFDGTFKHLDPVFNDSSFNNIPAVLYAALTNNDTKGAFEYFLPHGYTITPTNASGSLTRSIMFIGCSNYGTKKCNSDSWKSTTSSFLEDTLKSKLESYLDNSIFTFYFFSYRLWLAFVTKQAMLDMLCAVGSMMFIFCFTIFHTRSVWIAGWGIFSILASFLGTNIVYVGVIDFQYFGFFHILSIFIILGIGADDLFVFYDNWRLTAFSTYPSLAHRLSDTYSKSVVSMLITSLTTSVAFFSSAISPLLATRSFGVFSGLLVIYNYLSVIIFFPTVIIVYHVKFEEWSWPCCRCCTWPSCFRSKKASESDREKENKGELNEAFNDLEKDMYTVPGNNAPLNKDSIPNGTTEFHCNVTVNGEPVQYHKHGVFTDDTIIPNGKTPNGNLIDEKMTKEISDPDSETNKKQSHWNGHTPEHHKKTQKKLVVFFRDYYLRFVTHSVTRWVLLPLYACIIVFFAYNASTLEPDNEELKILKDSHYFSKARNKELYAFVKSDADNLVTIHIAWGIGLKDRSACHFSSINCRGTQVYDSSFDPNPVANQQALKDFCDSLYNMTASDIARYRIKQDSNGALEIACFTRNLEAYLKSLSVGGLDLSLPWDYTKTLAFMNAQTTYYDTSGFNSSFKDVLSIPMQYWMYDGYSYNYTADYGMYNSLFGEENGTQFSTPLNTNNNTEYGNKIKYIGVQVNTTIKRQTTGYSEGIPLIELWESYINNKMLQMPSGVNKAFQLTWRSWHWMYVIKTLADNAVLGIVIGVSLALPILTISTMNVVIGFLATISICCTTTCVIGVIPLAGWKLGLLVSLNMCLVVGLAVDYVVHLAEGYTLSLHKDRYNRTRDMLEEMGPSVFSGACTTLGASLFMFAAQVQFFMQFGIFMFCTIGFSLIFSLGLFTILVGLIGPENNTGNLKVLFEKCKSKCQNVQSKKVGSVHSEQKEVHA